MRLRSGTFNIQQWEIGLPTTTYQAIWNDAEVEMSSAGTNKDQRLSLTFTTPTSFRKRGNHMPLPIPENVFHSYLRRWNNLAHLEFEQSDFLDWVNECVVVLRHDVRSQKTQAGKQGSVTGFVGNVQFGLTPKAKAEPEYVQLVHALMTCAPYFGTGHKVTFELGQTQTGWFVDRPAEAEPQGDGNFVGTLHDRRSFMHHQFNPNSPQEDGKSKKTQRKNPGLAETEP
jgi:CRISPR-associated endoribonuclease Cas6